MPGLTPAGSAQAVRDAALMQRLGREIMTGAPVTGLRFLPGTMVAALGDGSVRFWANGSREPGILRVHAGAILALAAGAGGTVLTGGDDGRVCRVGPSGSQEIGASGGRWIDAVAEAPCGAVAYAHGRCVTIVGSDGERRDIALPSTAPGLAVAPDGQSLAIAHYGGVTIVDMTAPAADRLLPWAGSHVAVSFSPDGRFVVSAMNENALHGWRLDDGEDMRMSGYPAKPKIMSWSSDGQWLATSGADCVVLWPFQSGAGPMGRGAVTIAAAEAMVTSVACHPLSDVVAAGYDNGAIVFAKRSDNAVLDVRDPDGDPVTAIGFDDAGGLFGYGTEGGALGLVDIAGANE